MTTDQENLVFKNDVPVRNIIDFNTGRTFTAYEKAGDSEELKDAYTVWKGTMDEYRQAIKEGRDLTDPIPFNEVTYQRLMVNRVDPEAHQEMLNEGEDLLNEADNLIDRLTVVAGGESNKMLNILMLAQVVLIRDRIQGPFQKGLYPRCMDHKISECVAMRFKDYWLQYVKSYGERVAIDPTDIISV